MMMIADRLAEFSKRLRFEDLPTKVVHEVKRRIVDSLGCAFGSWRDEPCKISRNVAMRYADSNGAAVWGTAHLAPPDWAAFANGCLVRYLDYNDTYLSKEPAHPSDNIPAAFAVAQSQKRSGRDLITAIVLAYEVQCRLCDAVSIRARGWDHVTYGTFSVALAAAKLMNLSPAATVHALGIAGIQSAHLRQSRAGELSHWKGCAFAGAARHGIFASTLAADGMTGPAPIFEGVFGFEKLVSGPLNPVGPFADASSNFDLNDLMILKTSIKYWPVEYHAQSAVEASLELRKQIGDPSEIESAEIQSHEASVDIIGSGPERWKPTSRETADHSLPYIVAAALVDGEMTSRQFDPARFADPNLLELLKHVTVTRNPELTAKYPGEVGNIVTVKLKNGQSISKRVDIPIGNAWHPLADAQIEEKFHRQSDPLIGHGRAAAIAEWIWKLQSQNDVSQLTEMMVIT